MIHEKAQQKILAKRAGQKPGNDASDA